MISLMIEFALFLLVLFVLVPGVMIAWMMARQVAHQHPKPAVWHKDEAPTKLAS